MHHRLDHRVSFSQKRAVMASMASAASISAILLPIKGALHTIQSTFSTSWTLPDASLLLDFYKTTDPLHTALLLCLFFAAYSWISSIIFRNCSQVDRTWSLVPIVYMVHFAFRPYLLFGEPINPRLCLMAILVIFWGIRLSFNYARKGGYSWGHEDYRWANVRKTMSSFQFQLLNFFFIAIYQNILLLLIILPAYPAYLVRHSVPLTPLDAIAAGLFLALVVVETIADEQQWAFQSEKHRRIKSKMPLTGDYAQGFLSSGLFLYSRHPNFISEISLWFVFYMFSVAATGTWLNYSLVGAVLLCLLFQASTSFTEKLSVQKYPGYRQYQKTTPCLVPWNFLLDKKQKKPRFVPPASLVDGDATKKKKNK